MLEIARLNKDYPTSKGGIQHVLRDVNLQVQPGEFICLIGHSGCGKSTLLNMIGGLATPTSGWVALDGEEISEAGPDRAMVFQRPSLLPGLSLEQNVAVAAHNARPDRSDADNNALVEHYLRAVGLWEQRSKRPHQVSGGMAQRTAVARAFAVQPRVLLLDEPFGALDALTRVQLQRQLVDLWRGDSDTEMVVMVTHGIDEAALLADRIIVMGNPPGQSVVDVISVDVERPRHGTETGLEALRVVEKRLFELLHAA